MANFTPVSALIGGALIGIAASLLLLMNGRLAGISSIVGGVVSPQSRAQAAWRGVFLAGLVGGALIHLLVLDPGFTIAFDAPLPVLLIGGALIGIAASLLLLMNGRLAGISSIVGGVVSPQSRAQAAWRGVFLAGLVGGGLIHLLVLDPGFTIAFDAPLPVLLIGGLLVGVGTRIGAGCTSGHGVCGLARLSPRSLAATLTFMAVGMAVVFAVRHLAGGW